MTNHELKRRLARHDGFTIEERDGLRWYRKHGMQVFPTDLPDYPEDLIALRRIEMKLTDQQRIEYQNMLMGDKDMTNAFDVCDLIMTSPFKRAEALLIVLGK